MTISSLQGLGELPSGEFWLELSVAMVESDDKVAILDMRQKKGPEDLGAWTAGVAFGENAELRWRRRSQGLHVVLIAANNLPGATNERVLNPSDGETSFLLWGKRAEKDRLLWEDRIPREFAVAGEDGADGDRLIYPAGTLLPERHLNRMRIDLAWHTMETERPLVTAQGVKRVAGSERICRWVRLSAEE